MITVDEHSFQDAYAVSQLVSSRMRYPYKRGMTPLMRAAKNLYLREWVTASREEWIKENGPCVRCETWDDLTVDNTNYKTKKISVASIWGLAKNNPKRIVVLEKCQVLCVNCKKTS